MDSFFLNRREFCGEITSHEGGACACEPLNEARVGLRAKPWLFTIRTGLKARLTEVRRMSFTTAIFLDLGKQRKCGAGSSTASHALALLMGRQAAPRITLHLRRTN
jgi:hypothetical protein